MYSAIARERLVANPSLLKAVEELRGLLTRFMLPDREHARQLVLRQLVALPSCAYVEVRSRSTACSFRCPRPIGICQEFPSQASRLHSALAIHQQARPLS